MEQLPLKDNQPNVPFICTLSNMLRLVARASPSASARIQETAAALANDIDKNQEVANSLKSPMIGATPWRQVDIRADADNALVLKTFIRWSNEYSCWHIFAELPDDDEWEKRGAIVTDEHVNSN